MEIYFLKILSIFHVFKNTIYWIMKFVSKWNCQYDSDTVSQCLCLLWDAKRTWPSRPSSILCCPEWQGGADRSKWLWPGKATGTGSGGSAEPLVAAPDQSSSSWSRPEATALASQTKIMISLELFNPLSEKIIPNAHDTQHKYHIYMCCH